MLRRAGRLGGAGFHVGHHRGGHLPAPLFVDVGPQHGLRGDVQLGGDGVDAGLQLRRDHGRVDAAAEPVDGGHEIIHQTR
jgi:hypothetical protein